MSLLEHYCVSQALEKSLDKFKIEQKPNEDPSESLKRFIRPTDVTTDADPKVPENTGMITSEQLRCQEKAAKIRRHIRKEQFSVRDICF